jgi:hypothetical protein
VNHFEGQVLVKETSVGVPGLVVVFYDIDPGTRADTDEISARVLPDGDRIGSVLTGSDGKFSLSYEDTEFRVRNEDEKRPDLLLVVQGPDEPGRPGELNILYRSTIVRANAGLTESFSIQIPASVLAKAGVPIPSSSKESRVITEPAESIGQRVKANQIWQSEIISGTIQTARERVEQHKGRFEKFHSVVKPALYKAFSRVPDSLLNSERFVARGESVFEKSKAMIERGLRDVITSENPVKRAPRRGLVSLTETEKAELMAQADADGNVPYSALQALKDRNRPNSSDSVFERTSTVEQVKAFCRDLTVSNEKCAKALFDDVDEDHSPTTPEPIQPGPSVDALKMGDLHRYLARLVNTITSPEEQLLEGLTPAATRESVGENLRTLSIKPSPADAPAVHYFSQLQIAFEHVWQEAIDEGALQIAEDAYETIVELGGKPEDVIIDPVHGHDPVGGLKTEGLATLRAARIVRDHRGENSGTGSAQGGVTVTSPSGPGQRPPQVGSGTRIDWSSPEVRLPALLEELDKRRKEAYAFTIFAANRKERSVNFGTLNTYSLRLDPRDYQAGALIKTIPLAPRQSQKLVITRKTSKKRSVKEVENNLRSARDEMSQTSRVEQEIIKRATSKTTFSIGAKIDDKVGDSTTTNFTQDAGKSSDDVKKSMHEAVFKSALEVKLERSTTITSEESDDFESQETTEVSNPNDEIHMNFLFYELQRQYRVNEELFRIQPVVLVAQEVPRPDEIDADWIVQHDWILKRVLLDDSFESILTSVCQTAGDETALAELKINIDQQRRIVSELREEVADAKQRSTIQNALLEKAIYQKVGGEGLTGLVTDILGSLPGPGAHVVEKVSDILMGGSAESNAANRQALEDRAQKVADEARDLMFRLEREVTALNSLMETYAKALREHHTRLTELARLQTHIAKNILYYMQAIWNHEPSDQTYFRLHETPVPTFEEASTEYKIDFANPKANNIDLPHQRLPRFGDRQANAYSFEAKVKMNQTPQGIKYVPLSQVAYLDRHLGYIGNYMIFPLRESNPLTDFMMDPFVDRATGQLMDPSDIKSWSLEEFSDYVCCLKDHLPPDDFEELREELKNQYQEILISPRRKDELLVVPTDSLFIEALPGKESLLERYKLVHRLEDAKLAQAKVRGEEINNLRRAARILKNEFEDADIDQKVVIQGNPGGVVVPNTPTPPPA